MINMRKILVTIFGFLIMISLVVAVTTLRDTTSTIQGINNTGVFITKDPYIDVRAFGAVGDGIIDDSYAIQAAVNSINNTGGTIFFPVGVYNTTRTVYLNSSVGGNLTYIIRGDGKGTIFKPCFTNTGNTTYIFNLNEDSTGAHINFIAHHPHAIFENFQVDGIRSVNASLLHTQYSSFAMKYISMKYLYYGAYAHEYTDNVQFEQIYYGIGQRDGGWMYRQQGNGDSLYANEVFMGATTKGFRLSNNGGALLEALNGGSHKFENSKSITVIGGHFEHSGGPAFVIEGGDVTFINNWFGSGGTNEGTNITDAGIYIDDNGDRSYKQKSSVILRDNVFHFNAGLDNDTRGGADIYIENVGDYTSLIMDNNKGNINPNSFRFDYLCPWMRSTNTDINSLFTNELEVGCKNIELKKVNDVWTIDRNGVSSNFGISRSIDDPAITYNATSTVYSSTFSAAETYYYNIAIYSKYGNTNSGVEKSAVIQNNNESVAIVINARYAPTTLRLWRGTSSESYDKYVDIPIAIPNIEFYDQGSAIAGYPWITTDIPSVPTVGNTYEGANINGTIKIFSLTKSGAGNLTWNGSCTGINNKLWVC